ncbi:BICD family-like cargo adapter 1 isoform X1 [Carcharodon carcharias]|uniref:BICD family-like cargo adapter 1 isoform X1 n=1 Tax=Carcharodon carcharias TaxID=13397 RepID=UPI001B7EEEDC|nr:BICD family-like cargo adapter 1 isoform X1 [Carcharodon carcharias]
MSTGTGGLEMKSPLEEDLFPFTRDHVGDVSAFVEPAELLSLLRQREKEVHVAAELGKALLSENQDLKRENDKLQEEFTQKLEELEQEKYASHLKHEGKKSEWEAQVAELESDVQRLQLELQKQQQYLREVEKVKMDMECNLSEQNQRLVEQLKKAVNVEQTLTHQIHTLRDRFMGKEFLLNENATQAQSLHTEIALLSEQKHNLEQQTAIVQKENLALKSSIDAMQEKFSQLQQKNTEQLLQLTLSQENVNEVQALNQQLRSRMQDLSQQLMMQEFTSHNDSLHSEIEHSLETEAETWEAEKDQVKNNILKIHQQLLTLKGEKCSDSLIGRQIHSLQEALSHLKNLVHSLVRGPATQVLGEGSQEGLQEELKRERQQFQWEQGVNEEKQQMIEELQRQLQLQSTELVNLRKENDGLRCSLENDSGDRHLQQAIRERDIAITKKNAVELELLKCQMDMKSLNSQLLETIQQKVCLSQELEAWQDDMQFVISQQLKTQQQTEQAWNASSQNHSEYRDSKHRHSFLYRTRSQIPEGKGFLSLFKRLLIKRKHEARDVDCWLQNYFEKRKWKKKSTKM